MKKQSYTEMLYLNDLEGEIWKPVVGFKNYLVSNLGRIKSLERTSVVGNGGKRTYPSRIMKCQSWQGYYRTQLIRDGKSITVKVHRLVAEAFIANPNNLPQVNHKDEDKTNNTVANLEWCTAKYNIHYNGRQKKIFKKQLENGTITKRIEEMREATIKKIVCTTTGEIFNSIKEASLKYNIDSSGITKCARHKLNYCGKIEINGKIEKLKWEYVSQYRGNSIDGEKAIEHRNA